MNQFGPPSEPSFSVKFSGKISGTKVTGSGTARVPNASTPGRLLYHDLTADLVFYVQATGPIVSGYYQWIIASEGQGLYVIARNVDAFSKIYASTVLAELESLGYSSHTIIDQTKHSCMS